MLLNRHCMLHTEAHRLQDCLLLLISKDLSVYCCHCGQCYSAGVMVYTGDRSRHRWPCAVQRVQSIHESSHGLVGWWEEVRLHVLWHAECHAA